MKSVKYFSRAEVREALDRALRDRTMTSLAEEIGVPIQSISVMRQGAPINGKVLAWLGFERVDGIFRKVRKGKAKK